MVRLVALKGKVTRIRFDIIVLGFLKDVRPLRGIAADIDWAYSGAISRMILEEKISGTKGEALLMATGDKMETPRLLLLGLGDKANFSYDTILKFSSDLAGRLSELKLAGCAVEIPTVPEPGLDKIHSFDSIISGFKMGSNMGMDMTILVKDDATAEELEERVPI